MRALTMNEGAERERAAILTMLRQQLRKVDQTTMLGRQVHTEIKKMIHWIEGRSRPATGTYGEASQ